MKKIIFGFGLSISLLSCITKTTPVDYALISGKIDNLDATEIIIGKSGNLIMKKIALDSNGFFKDTIKAVPGLFILTVGKQRSTVYLDYGDNITFNADSNNFKSTIDISGSGSEVTKYLRYASKKSNKLKGKAIEYYKLDETSFKDKAKEVSINLTQVIDTFTGIKNSYKTLERRNLNYIYLNEISRYEEYHQRMTNNPDFKTSNDYLLELDGLDLNNGQDFEFSGAYKQIVNRYYNEKISDFVKNDSLELPLTEITIYSKIKNPIIKNQLLFTAAQKGITKTGTLENYYQLFSQASSDEDNNASITEIYNKLKKITKGKASPKFYNYENNAGGTLSLDDLKGKYIYIDVWATWCAPCIAQVPYLKTIEKDYHGKNITFLSISIDTPKDYDKWKKMIIEKELGGIQLIADKDSQSQFAKDYIITSIPRFILIDPNGNIVSKHAPRPSSPKLIDLFNALNI
jgi:thiol-disulfide isomerase/thioredoxin